MLIRQLPWGSQPQEMVGVAPEWDAGVEVAQYGGQFVRKGSNRPITVATGSPTIRPGIGGIGAAFTGGLQSFELDDVGALDAGPFTIEVLCSITAASSLAGFFSAPYNGVTNGSARGLIAFGGGSNRNIYFWGSGADLASGVDWRIDGSLQHVFITSAGSGGAMRFYRDGSQIASGTTPAIVTRSPTTGKWRVGDTSNGWNSSPTGVIFLSAYHRRELSAAEVLTRTDAAWQLFAPRRIYIPASVAGGPGAQSLTPTLYSNAQTFYTPTVSTGAASLAPALYSNAQTFYAPTVTRGAVSLAPTLYSNAQAFYSATVTQGAVLAPALYSNSQAFYAPTVSAGAVTLTPALYSNAQSFYSATVLNAGQILAPGLYSNAQAFYSPTVGVGAVTLTPALFTNSSTFYAASVSDGAASGFIKYFDVLSGRLLILRAL